MLWWCCIVGKWNITGDTCKFIVLLLWHLFCIFVQVRFQYTFETVSGFIIPYAVIIMCYVLILRRLRQTICKSSRAVTSAFAFTSSCANPVLYTFAGKSYIKQNGFAFMARLFEGTSLDQTGNKKSRLTRKDNIGNNIDSSNCSTIPISLGVDLWIKM